MKMHTLKIYEQPFNDLLSGAKAAEVRVDDRGFQVGGTVELHEIADTFTGRVMRRQITHIQTGYGLPDGLCVLSYATHPAPASVGGVEVVAYHGKDPDGGEGFVGARWPNAFGQECVVEPLMTVAQHNRIMAAAAPSAVSQEQGE